MVLATRCPHCQTTFRVAHDQLKLRAGLVRCGACKEIFNGVEHLLPTSAPPPPDQGSIPTTASTTTASTPSSLLPDESVPTPGKPVEETNQSTAPAAPEKQIDETQSVGMPTDSLIPGMANKDAYADPLQRMTLMDFSAWKESDENTPIEQEDPANADNLLTGVSGSYSQTEQPADASDALDQAIDDLQRKPWRRKRSGHSVDDDIEGDEDVSEPDFVRQAHRQHRMGRILRLLMRTGSVVLLFALVIQATFTFRNQIAAWFPQATPILIEACALIGCDVGFPTQIESVSIESSELQTLVPNQNTFVLNTLLRNRSSVTQAWPSIELTLNDANEKAIARRVFSPREYLVSASDLKKGFDANSEQPVKVFFELSELKASGYRVYLFYP